MLKSVWCALLLCVAPAYAVSPAKANTQDVSVSDAYARPTVAGQSQGGAFLRLHNSSTRVQTLLSAETPIAARTELHTHIHENGVMKMRQIKGIRIPAKGTVVLEPGGLHLMFFDLKHTLEVGKSFPVKLKFDTGRSQTVTVTVRPLEKTKTQGHQHHHH